MTCKTLFSAFFLCGLLCLARPNLNAQDVNVFESVSIFEDLAEKGPENNYVVLHQDAGINACILEKAAENRNNRSKMAGYRIRIFFDNRQTARQESEKIMNDFLLQFPQTAVYREYVDPYFKVSVGDFRTKSEAMRFFKNIVGLYPSAFITRENIGYPQL